MKLLILSLVSFLHGSFAFLAPHQLQRCVAPIRSRSGKELDVLAEDQMVDSLLNHVDFLKQMDEDVDELEAMTPSKMDIYALSTLRCQWLAQDSIARRQMREKTAGPVKPVRWIAATHPTEALTTLATFVAAGLVITAPDNVNFVSGVVQQIDNLPPMPNLNLEFSRIQEIDLSNVGAMFNDVGTKSMTLGNSIRGMNKFSAFSNGSTVKQAMDVMHNIELPEMRLPTLDTSVISKKLGEVNEVSSKFIDSILPSLQFGSQNQIEFPDIREVLKSHVGVLQHATPALPERLQRFEMPTELYSFNK